MSETVCTVLVVEDNEITRFGLRVMLEKIEGISVIGEAEDGITAIKMVQELKPALVLMDIGLPGINGIEATKRIKTTSNTRVIIISSHETDEDIFAGLSAGADAYCLKGVTQSQLETAIRTVRDDAMWLDPGIARKVVQLIKPNAPVPASGKCNPFNLTEREMEVLSLLVEGASNRQMAERLFLSAETVKTHMRKLMEKLSVTGRTQAAIKAVREGLITETDQGD